MTVTQSEVRKLAEASASTHEDLDMPPVLPEYQIQTRHGVLLWKAEPFTTDPHAAWGDFLRKIGEAALLCLERPAVRIVTGEGELATLFGHRCSWGWDQEIG